MSQAASPTAQKPTPETLQAVGHLLLEIARAERVVMSSEGELFELDQTGRELLLSLATCLQSFFGVDLGLKLAPMGRH
jgi:hypothetical protein